MCHSVETAYSNINYMQLSNMSQIFRIIFFTIGRLGVPIFLFLTGALTLRKQIDSDDDVFKFYKHNLIPLFITIEIWNILYNVFLGAINNSFSIKTLVHNLLFLKQVNMSHMWYMPMILGMYLAIPFLAKIVKTFKIKSLMIPMIIVFISSILIPSINTILGIWKLEKYRLILDLSFLGGCYGLYVLLGYYIYNEGIFKKFKNIWIILISILTFFLTCLIQYASYNKGVNYNVWYNAFTLFICSTCLFELFRRVKNKDKETVFIKCAKNISKIALGIFFVHAIFLKLLKIRIYKFDFINPIETMIYFVLSFLISVIIILVYSKIKIIKEKVFFIKG